MREKRLKRHGGDSLSCFPLPAANPSPPLQPPSTTLAASPSKDLSLMYQLGKALSASFQRSRPGVEAQAHCFMRASTVFSASHVAHLMMFICWGQTHHILGQLRACL